MKRALKAALIVAAVPAACCVAGILAFDLWRAYRKDPAALEDLLNSFLHS